MSNLLISGLAAIVLVCGRLVIGTYEPGRVCWPLLVIDAAAFTIIVLALGGLLT